MFFINAPLQVVQKIKSGISRSINRDMTWDCAQSALLLPKMKLLNPPILITKKQHMLSKKLIQILKLAHQQRSCAPTVLSIK
jgi:hypothetical protein